MPTSYSAYSPLESLLLFQALSTDAIQPSSFNKISDQLKSITLITSEPTFDSGRLSPDALRELYLDLLKEEVKADLERQLNGGDKHLNNGDVSPGSRKRKAPSPSLPTVKEAAKHSHLIPQLVTRLYARYRSQVTQKLRAHEAKYADVQRQKEEIDARKWDDTFLRKGTTSQTQSPRPSPKLSSSAHTQPEVAHQAQTARSATGTPPVQQKEGDSDANAKRYSQARIESMINHGPEAQDSPGGHRRASSNTTLPPLSEMAPQSPRFGIPPKIPGPGPHQPMQPMPPGGYTHSPPAGQQSPYPPQHAHPRTGSVGSPQVQQSLSRPSSSPRPILPPPKGMPLAPVPHNGSPNMHGAPMHPQQHHPSPQQQYQHPPPHRVPSGPSPTDQGPPRGYPTTPLAPHPGGGYYQQQPAPQYLDRRTSYPMQQTPQGSPYPNQPPPPHQGGYMLPPFQVASQDPTKPLQPIRPHQMPPHGQRPPAYLPHGHNGPATAPRPQLPPRLVSDVVSALATPPRPKARPLWKSEFRPSPLQVPAPKPRPEIEPLSPTLGRAKSPARSTRSTRGRDPPTIEERLQAEPASKTRARRRRGRDKSPHSVVSSTADESLRTATRSQSVSTVAGVHPPSDDRPSSRSGVKAEPSTPANMLEDAEPTATASATPMTGVMTRKRRGTVQSHAQPPAKRRRQEETPAAEAEDQDMSTPPPRGNIVIATRNFAKMCSAVMNDIASHKHGTYFAKEVRDKDAPGYSDIVKQPQNLKSIRSAITAGARAIAAATTTESPSATSSSSTTVELERTADLIPPKAIVNSAQLEKELMRMFANAYMFNPGEDGMALSTKEMFHDVEQTIGDWRGTNREAAGEDEEDSKTKRRKG